MVEEKGRFQIKEERVFMNGVFLWLTILLPIPFFGWSLLMYGFKPEGTFHHWVLEFPIWYCIFVVAGYMDHAAQDTRVYRIVWVGLTAWLIGKVLFLDNFNAGLILGFIFAVVVMIKPLLFKRSFVPMFLLYLWIVHVFLGLFVYDYKWYKLYFPELIQNTVGGWMIILPLILAIVSTKLIYIEEDVVIEKDYDRLAFVREKLKGEKPKKHYDDNKKM